MQVGLLSDLADPSLERIMAHKRSQKLHGCHHASMFDFMHSLLLVRY